MLIWNYWYPVYIVRILKFLTLYQIPKISLTSKFLCCWNNSSRFLHNLKLSLQWRFRNSNFKDKRKTKQITCWRCNQWRQLCCIPISGNCIVQWKNGLPFLPLTLGVNYYNVWCFRHSFLMECLFFWSVISHTN